MHFALPTVLVREFVRGDVRAELDLRARLKELIDHIPPYTHALYFGCIDQPGHYLWGSSKGRRPLRIRREGQDTLLGKPGAVRKEPNEPPPLVPWGLHVDGGLMPKQRSLKQGEAILAHERDWTALSFWDRTVDTRSGSVSVYLFNAEMEFHQALSAAMEEFPTIFERYDFEIVPAP